MTVAHERALQGQAGDEPVTSRMDSHILRLTLENPPANALSVSMMAALQAELDRAAQDDDVRVIVLSATGKVFSGGHDLKEMTAHRRDDDAGRAFFEQTFAACSRLMRSVVEHPRPIIAAVDGIATAAGCQLVASCDLAIATDRSAFGVNGINLGLFCSTPAVALSRKVARKHAMEMLLTGEMIDAATAREFGLVNRVVPEEYLNQIVDKYAQTIALKSPFAIQLGKKAFYAQAEMSMADAYEHTSRAIVENMMHADAETGIAAFFDRRKPRQAQE